MSRGLRRRVLGAAILVVLGASAAYGGGFFGLRDRFSPPAARSQGSPFGAPVDQEALASGSEGARRSQPYWRPVRRFSGTGSGTSPAFAIDRRAIQWRVWWRCERGSLLIQPQRPSGESQGHALADASCPDRSIGYSVAPGSFRLGVRADGPWTARVEQQLDVPLAEPATRAMRSPGTRRVAGGHVYDIDEEGEGRLTVYREPDGGVSVRLENFYVTPNVDLELRLSELARPRSTKAVLAAPHRDVGYLKATSGSMNYRIPPEAFTDRVRSVVIWCEITRNAYAAVSLRR